MRFLGFKTNKIDGQSYFVFTANRKDREYKMLASFEVQGNLYALLELSSKVDLNNDKTFDVYKVVENDNDKLDVEREENLLIRNLIVNIYKDKLERRMEMHNCQRG